MFQLCDKVTSKFTGFPGCGFVGAILAPHVFVGTQPDRELWESENNRWNKLFGNTWRNKPIFWVVFEEVRKPVTLEELKLSNPDQSDYEIQEVFDNMQETNIIAYPYDDLELFED